MCSSANSADLDEIPHDNSEDPNEMPHYVAFHQGLHYLLRQREIEIQFSNSYLDVINWDPQIYTVDHPKIIVPNQKDESISA